MAEIGGWLARGNRAVVLGTTFIVLVLTALVVTPIAISTFAIGAHGHIRDVVEPLDQDQEQIGVLMARAEASALRYVITGDDELLAAYHRAAQDLDLVLTRTRERAEGESREAVRRVEDVEQAIRRWQDLTEPVLALRQEGRTQEAQAMVATGVGAGLIEDFWQQQEALHDYIVAVRDDDRDRIDQALSAGMLVGLVLGVLGVLAALMVAGLATNTARLLREVRLERARASEIAAREQQRADEMNAIVENMAEGLVVINAGGRVVHMNGVARQVWQLPWPEGSLGPIGDFAELDLRYSDGRPIPQAEWPTSKVLRGETFTDLEALYTRSDGATQHLRFGGSAVRDEAGKVALAVVVFNDVTAIRDLERQREEFISVVAHDLRNPITVIAGYADLLSHLAPDRHNTQIEFKAVQTIATSNRRLERMVEDLLDVSRIEAKRLALAKDEIDLPGFVREAIERQTKVTEGHPVRLEAPGPTPPVQADPARLEQILSNLLSNAAKYSYPETEIIVTVEPSPGEAMVSVTNEGPGIPPEDRQQLFTRFHRTRMATAEKVPGLGLGLYITKGLIEAHGGRIWVESEVGRYTTFQFILPAG